MNYNEAAWIAYYQAAGDRRYAVKRILRSIVKPLMSRKVRTGLATAITAYLVTWFPGLTEDQTYIMIGVVTTIGIAIIGGTSIEDAGAKVGMPPTTNRSADPK